MAYTLNQSIVQVRYLLNEDTASYWSDTQLTAWLQQGTLDWCEKSLLYNTRDTITLVSGQYLYTTSTSSNIDTATRILHAEYANKAMQRVTYEQIRGHNARTIGSTTAPMFYYDQYFGTALNVFIGPTPTATEDGNTITVVFGNKTTDITLIPDEFQPTVFLFAAYKAKFRERQYQEAYLYYQQYINNITFSRSDSLTRGIQRTDDYRIK